MQNLSDADKLAICSGKYKGEKIQLYGITHYKYEDCASADLVMLSDARMKVHRNCAQAFKVMQKSAKADGIKIKVVSGYRSSRYQIQVFRYKFIDKLNPTEQELEARLKFSAPSGYSEHHTGLAIDINDIEEDFATTDAYEWLVKNAKDFGFEMSFSKNNKQNLGYEPWHWRYVGDEESEKIFFLARNSK